MGKTTEPGPLVSVIIPTLNEKKNLPGLLAALKNQNGLDLELIVADGGSDDGTADTALRAGAEVVTAPRGRGIQMNAGAKRARGDYLLFLHADSEIRDPSIIARGVEAMDTARKIEGHDRIAGHFRIAFIRTTNANDFVYRYMEAKSGLNRTNTTNGDQGFLLPKSWFTLLGGFDESLPFLEDQRLAERIRRNGTWITLPGTIFTSARRFETEGFYRRHILMAILMGLYSTGFTAFFDHAPQVYRAQHDASRLLVTPFLRLIRNLTRQMGFRERFRAWFRVGRYVRLNFWQTFFCLDVRLGRGNGGGPFLAFHDRVVGPLMDCALIDFLFMAGTYIWVMGVLSAWYRLRDDKELRALKNVKSGGR